MSQGVRNLTVMRCGERITKVYSVSDVSYCVVKNNAPSFQKRLELTFGALDEVLMLKTSNF